MTRALTLSLRALALFGALALTSASALAQPAPAWRFQLQTADFVSYLDTNSILRHGDLVWYHTAKVYRTPQGGTAKWPGWLTLYEGRCGTFDNKATRMDGLDDSGGYREWSTQKPTEWSPTQPGQVGRKTLEHVCGKPLPPGTALTSTAALVADGKARLGIR